MFGCSDKDNIVILRGVYMAVKIEIRCKAPGCNRLLMNYFTTGHNVEMNLNGFEIKCDKCKRLLHLKNYTEENLIHNSENRIFRI